MKSRVESSELTSPEEGFGKHPPTLSQDASGVTGQDELLEPIVVHADSILGDLIPEYLEDCKAGLPIIHGALEQNDYPALRNIGHDLEGTGGAFGFYGLAELGRALRLAASEEDNSEIDKIADQMETYLGRVEVAYD